MPTIIRPAWNGFPDVVIAADVAPVKAHPEYEQAKAGNVQDAAAAAKRLSAAFLSAATLKRIRSSLPSDVALVPVHAMEGGGLNRIPGAFAELLAEKLDCEVEIGIVQANIVNHTGASGWERLTSAVISKQAAVKSLKLSP